MRRCGLRGARLLVCVFLALCALASSASAAVPRSVSTADVKRYWNGSLSATRSMHDETVNSTATSTESLAGHVRTPQGLDSAEAVLDVNSVASNLTETHLDTTTGLCNGQRITSSSRTMSFSPNQSVGVWIGHPRDPGTGVPGPMSLTVPNFANERQDPGGGHTTGLRPAVLRTR